MLERALIANCMRCVPGWAEAPRASFTVQQLTGGLTNRMFIVSNPRLKTLRNVVVRVHPQPTPIVGPDVAGASVCGSIAAQLATLPRITGRSEVADLLSTPQAVFIDRDLEDGVLEAVSDAGIAPRIWGHGTLASSYFEECLGEDEGSTGEAPEAEQDLIVRVEEWVAGPTLVAAELPLLDIYTQIAVVLRKLHAVPVSTIAARTALASQFTTPALERVMVQCLWLCGLACSLEPEPHLEGESSPVASAEARFRSVCATVRGIMTEFDLTAEADWMLRAARTSGSPLLLTHNDAQPGNWLNPGAAAEAVSPAATDGADLAATMPPELPRGMLRACHHSHSTDSLCSLAETRLALIDYEYAGMNFRGFEFGNLFCEFTFDYHHPTAPYFRFCPEKYPSIEIQRNFFTAYLAAGEDAVTEGE